MSSTRFKSRATANVQLSGKVRQAAMEMPREPGGSRLLHLPQHTPHPRAIPRAMRPVRVGDVQGPNREDMKVVQQDSSFNESCCRKMVSTQKP